MVHGKRGHMIEYGENDAMKDIYEQGDGWDVRVAEYIRFLLASE